MRKQLYFCIGIQARSTSSRLPNKIARLFGDDRRMVIDHVIDSCKRAALYTNRYTHSHNATCDVFVLIPKDDPIKDSLILPEGHIIEGDENDVLSRYVQMSDEHDATHIVRVTSDCPLIKDGLISKAITCAIKNEYDYCQNVDDLGPNSARTSIDGHDVEVLSLRALDWLNKNASTKEHREHVTSLLRQGDCPTFLKRGFIFADEDRSDLKLSIDTEEDFKRAEDAYNRAYRKYNAAVRKYGKNSVHRYS